MIPIYVRKKRKRGHGSNGRGTVRAGKLRHGLTGTARRRLIIHLALGSVTGSQNGLLHGFFFWDRLKLLQSREPKMTPPRAAASRGRAGGSEEGAERERVDEMGT